MYIYIIKYKRLYKVVVEDDNNFLKEDIYKKYTIYFTIDQENINLLIDSLLCFKNGSIKQSCLEDLERFLERFIILQNNLFLLNIKELDDKLDKVLSCFKSSSNIIVSTPENTTIESLKTKFTKFLETVIKITKNEKDVLVSTEIKTPFFEQEKINIDWKNLIFKEINIELNKCLNEWVKINSIQTKITKASRTTTKQFFGVSF